MDTPMHAINESSLMLGNATGHAQVLGLPLNWVETNRALSLLLAFACCVVATLLSAYNIVQHLAHYSRPQLQRYIVRILVVVPVYALGSLLSLTFVNQALYFDSIRDCYEAFVVYSFLALVLSFAGGESVCVLKMQSEPDIRHPWPLSRCFEPVGRDGRLLRLCKRATIQFVFIKPIFAALSLLMLACGKYHTLAYQLILVVVYNISYSVALYGLWLFYLATRHILQPFNPVLKFFAVKSVVFLTFWQNSLLDFIPGITNEQTFAWKDFILCVEMVPFAFVHLLAFNSSQFKKNLDRLPDSEVLNNMKEVLSLSDILADAYHNFMPSYRDYMLQRGGESTGRARGKNKSSGFGDTSSSEGSPTPMAHNNPRVPRFVIDDEDDDEMEEIDLESNVSTTTSSAELPASTKNAMPELKLPAKKQAEATEEADAATMSSSATPESASQETKQEEPTEPLLKYERVGGHFHAIFKDDSLSCIALHVNFVCAGTYGGNVLLLELDGRFIRRLHQHYKKVNQVCIDETGQFIASCSDDGTVAVYTLFPSTSAGAGASDISGHKHASNQGKDAAARQISVSSTGGEVNIYNYFSAVYAVQLEDRYAMKREKSFACGGVGGQLIINKKGWIIDKESTVHEGEGPVQLIRWKDGLVAWANDWGVKVYDSDNDQRITYIERPPNCPPMELCRCHLEWQSNDVLLVAWAHTLRVVTFKKGHSGQPGSPTSAAALDAVENSSGTITAEVVALLTFDFFVTGISPWGGGSVVSVLAFRPPGSGSSSTGPSMSQGKSTKIEGEGESGEMPYPEVHVVRLDGKQVSADLLNLKGYQRLRASDYMMPTLRYAHAHQSNLESTDPSSIYDAGYGQLAYVCTPKDVVICRLRDADDRVQWALARKQYGRALDVALHDPRALRRVVLTDVMETYLGDLLRQKKFQKTAEEIHRLFTGGGEEYEKLWEKYVYVFAQRGQLSAIARYMPTASPRLPKVQYEMVLKHFLDSDPGQLLELIRKWPKPRRQDTPAVKQQSEGDVAPEYTETTHVFEPLYDAQAWINQLETVVRRRRIAEADADRLSVETMYLMEALAELYTATEQYDHALRIYLSQGEFCSNKDFAFKLITEHQLWSLVANKVVNLMRIDKAIAVRMLVNQTEQLKITDIVAQLEGEPELLHTYLHELVLHRLGEYNSEIYSALHEKQVALYAEFAPEFLLKFLQTSNFVPLEKAYKYCSHHTPPLWDTMIYILGRMGQHKKALDLILTQRGDINQAIQFVQDHDEGLWDYLIDLSLTSKDNVEELLKFASQHKIDPIKLIRKIPDDMEIENLKQKLIAIITNYRVQQNLCIGSRKVFDNDRVELLHRQVAAHKRGRRVAAKKACAICSELLRAPSSGMETVHACVFECGHCYHLPCLEEKMRMWKSAEAVESGDLNRALGCFVCDHSTRAYARSGDFNQQIAALTAAPARGVTEGQLQRAKDNLLNMASVAE